ncbi:hypothetical protein P8452_17068 [Trifolium repens]|nr:hypothetical protein P8452_17068 [Trifolium repens]
MVWSMKVTNSMANQNNQHPLRFPSYASRIVLANPKHVMLSCTETNFKYKCKIRSSDEPDNQGFYDKLLTTGWYEFMSTHSPQSGDILQFELYNKPCKLKVRIIPRSIRN